jgi:uncharacterized protein YbjT (DUF2867 family)
MTVLIFGGSGSAGGSVLRACLDSTSVGQVRAISRRRFGFSHPRLLEVLHSTYDDYTAVKDSFTGVDACFYCLGKSVRQVSGEAEYRTITCDYALAAARTLRAQSPMAVFHYISGRGTDLHSRFMWARVKAEAERDLMAQFDAVCWRPASIGGMPSASEPMTYKVVRPVARLILEPFRSLYVTGEDVGLAMLQATTDGARRRVIENAEIRDIADRARLADKWVFPNL